MDKEYFKKVIYKNKPNRIKEKFIMNNFPEFYSYINKKFKFPNFLEKLHVYVNGESKGCKECGGKTKFISFSKGYLIYCSTKCSANSKSVRSKYKKTNLIKYGVDNPSKNDNVKEKKKNTSLKNYGVEYPLQSKKVKSVVDKTIKQKYGVNNIFQSDEIKNRIKNNNLEKYGVEYNSQKKYVIEKIKQTNLEKYGETSFSKTKLFKKHMKNKRIMDVKKNIHKYSKGYELISIKDNKYKLIHIKCGSIFEIQPQLLRIRSNNNNVICNVCNPFHKIRSNSEDELYKFIEQYTEVEINNRSILNGKEIDMYIPSKKLAIEFNGLYWHSELFIDKNYHLNKTENCLLKNIQLIHIYEDDWIQKQNILKSMILNLIGETPNKIYARKTEIKEINDTKLVSNFLDENHLQGRVGSSVKLGLFHKDELVSLMTFGKLRKNLGQVSKKNHWELLRFCNKKYTNVIGGASKLFSYFIKNYEYESIISYASRDYSNGNLYYKLGFKLDKITKPGYYYIINGSKENRYNYRKDKLIKEGCDSNLTEHEIMLDKGYYRLYNTGNYKFIY